MPKFHFMLTLAIISICAISCDNSNMSNSDFIGEYEMTTEVITVYNDAEFDDNPIVKSNVAIYQEQNKLFVQTDCFGIPFIYGEDFNPSEIDNQQPDDNSNSNIVDVTPNTSVVVIVKGLLSFITSLVAVTDLTWIGSDSGTAPYTIERTNPFIKTTTEVLGFTSTMFELELSSGCLFSISDGLKSSPYINGIPKQSV